MRKIYLFIILVIYGLPGFAQYTYLPLDNDAYTLLDRLETLSGTLSDSVLLTSKPISRKSEVSFLSNIKSNNYQNNFSNSDYFNINTAIANSGEWEPNNNGFIKSKNPLGNTFYTTTTDLININKPNFFLSINPLLSVSGLYQYNTDKNFNISSTQGLALRSRIKNIIGLEFSCINALENAPEYYQNFVRINESLPGVRSFKTKNNAFYYFNWNGAINTSLIKDHIDLTVGYGNQFIGDGIRTLFLSNFSAPMPYVHICTRIWKLQYDNYFIKANPQSIQDTGLVPTKNKYIAAHYLSTNITRWLNIGLFESVTFARNGGFEIGYVNPIIFYRAIERSEGSPDKVAIGINAKVIACKTLQLYGQFLINEFSAKEFFANNGYMNNKWGAQLGFKYFNAFTINNLDLQGEVNWVRPYTYQHYSFANYTNNNLALAHPLGADFREVVGNINYSPMPRLNINIRGLYYEQGADTGSANFGSDIRKSYKLSGPKYGVKMINGITTKCFLVGANVSYQILPNLFFDIGATYRNHQVDYQFDPNYSKTWFINTGLRLNLERKNYWDF